MKRAYFLAVLFLFSLKVFSSHIVGGEIYYDCLGNNNYRITLKLYRDCLNGTALYDAPASIGVYDINGNLINDLRVMYLSVTQLPPVINIPCFTPPLNSACVEEAIYDTIVNLPAIPGGYNITYQRCCRNQTILNIVDPGTVGTTYTCHIPDVSIATCNSSPRFTYFPPIFLCANNPVNFDHSATDPDGDVLIYEFADPFDGASSIVSMPQPPAPPPYNTITWLPPYAAPSPMSSSVDMTLNSTTGMLMGTPNMIGQWVVGVRVKEYRNNQLISVNTRDFQFNVVSCTPVTVSSIPSQTTYCFGMTVNFHNNSINGTTWHWDFGDSLATNDTSNLITPTWTYSTPGVYNVMLIVNRGTACADTGYTSFLVYPLLNPAFATVAPQCFIGNNFNFATAGAFEGSGTFSWNFGANATPSTSSMKDISNVTFNTPGTYPVTLTVSENGCTMSFTGLVEVHPEPVLTYNPVSRTGCAPYVVQFSDSSFRDPSVKEVLWSFGDGNFSSQNSPSHTYTQPGVYTVAVQVITDNMCVGNLTFSVANMVTVNPSPVAGINAHPAIISMFDSVVTFTDLSQGATNCWIYFGDGDSSNNCSSTHAYSVGTYTAIQMVENQYGCKNYFHFTIEEIIHPVFWMPNAFTPNFDGKNEIFMPITKDTQNFRFVIFDRWGKLIFESDDTAKGWDGTSKGGTLCKEDIYIWKVEFESVGKHNEQHKYIGHVSLIK